MATIETSHVKALKFEIIRNNDNPSKQSVSGYISIDSTDRESSEILQKLSSAGVVEKFNLSYQNYAFTLLGASFKPTIDAKPEATYAFNARDVMLVREASY